MPLDLRMKDALANIVFHGIFFSIPKGQATILVVGGALEALNADHDVIRLHTNN